ncbi:MAG: hypothetical protein ACD_62C00573G0001, partial [uncultured bacterium]
MGSVAACFTQEIVGHGVVKITLGDIRV